jgi:uncharacterized protein (TIGR02246 family)
MPAFPSPARPHSGSGRPALRGLAASLLVAALAAAGGAAAAQDPEPAAIADTARKQDMQAIRTAAADYKAALDRGDGAALAALWTPDGDIIDEQGRVLNGRETVGRIVQPTDGSPPLHFKIAEMSLRFVTADVAIEDGTVEIMLPGVPVGLKGRFSATWTRQDGGWKLAGLRESRIDGGQALTLPDLDWMVGDWIVLDDGGTGQRGVDRPTIEVTVRWNPTRTFLLRDMKISPAGSAEGAETLAMHVTQRIGWDPLSRQIRSWVFSSDGGHGEAVWSRDGQSWVARATSVLPDGTQTSSLNIYSYDGKDRCTWRSIPTHVGSEHAHTVNLTLVRKSGESPR